MWLRTSARIGVLIACAGIPLAASAQQECATCHEETARAFLGTSHGRTFIHDKARAGNCTSCHTGAAAHAESGGEAKVLNPRHGSAEDANGACLTCHDQNRAQAHWRGSPHEAAGVRCASCHSVHGDARAAPSGLNRIGAASARCLACHTSHKAQLNQRSHHPVAEGQLECASCHDPHGSSGEKLIRAASVNDMCYSCHQEKRGPFLWEHSPVREDCLTCHKAHGSNQPSLLVSRTTQLCQSCHQQGRHQTLAGLPASVWNTNKQCVNCHSQIHGTNHPSGPLFQR